MIKPRNIGLFVVCAVLASLSLPCSAARGGLRRLDIGAKAPQFSGVDTTGRTYDYKHGAGKVLVVAFLSARQKRSAQAAADIESIVSKLDARAGALDVVIAVDDPNGQELFQSTPEQPEDRFHILLDSQYKLWGKYGVIATPTAVITDANDNILWVQAGYSYDFAPVVDARVKQALGITQDVSPETAGKVETVANDTLAARVARHLQMARILKEKGRIESAASEIQMARRLDPNSVDIILELGELYCYAGEADAALKLMQTVVGTGRKEKARISLVLGWAGRLAGELEQAEKLLLEATSLEPNSGRGLFELGRVYQAKGNKDKALESYQKALTLILGGR